MAYGTGMELDFFSGCFGFVWFLICSYCGNYHRHSVILLRMQFLIYQHRLKAFPHFLIYLIKFSLIFQCGYFLCKKHIKVLTCPPTHLKLHLADWKHFDSWLFGSIKNDATLLMIIFSLPCLVTSRNPEGAHGWILCSVFHSRLIDAITNQIYCAFDPVHILFGLKNTIFLPLLSLTLTFLIMVKALLTCSSLPESVSCSPKTPA